jgi:hypothetical protein
VDISLALLGWLLVLVTMLLNFLKWIWTIFGLFLVLLLKSVHPHTGGGMSFADVLRWSIHALAPLWAEEVGLWVSGPTNWTKYGRTELRGVPYPGTFLALWTRKHLSVHSSRLPLEYFPYLTANFDMMFIGCMDLFRSKEGAKSKRKGCELVTKPAWQLSVW